MLLSAPVGSMNSSDSRSDLSLRTVINSLILSGQVDLRVWQSQAVSFRAANIMCVLTFSDLSVDLVREFLTPHDTVTRMLAVARHIKKSRADFTCEWFDRHLVDFTRNGKELLLVTGNHSTGKSVLSEWVVERLQSIVCIRSRSRDSHALL